MYLLVPGFEPTYSVFLDECVTHHAPLVEKVKRMIFSTGGKLSGHRLSLTSTRPCSSSS